ncbi:MAG: glutathione S-transferase family protein, partial [SAR324 cluster bacterium]
IPSSPMATPSVPAGTLIHSRDSPYARRVRIVLAELGLPYDSRLHPTVFAIADLAGINPNLRIPVWQDDRGTLFDSGLIVEYLLTCYGAQAPGGPPSEARPPLARSMRRAESGWADAMLLATLDGLTDAGFLLRQLALSGVDEEQVRYLRRVRQRIPSALDWLEAQATPAGFVPGTFSAPDVWLVCALEWAQFRGTYSWRGRPKLEAIVARYAARPSVSGSAHPQ